MKTNFLIMTCLAAALSLGAFLVATNAQAGQWTTQTTATNPGGHQPPGQQTGNTGGGMTVETTVTNPGGNQPPGQQDKR